VTYVVKVQITFKLQSVTVMSMVRREFINTQLITSKAYQFDLVTKLKGLGHLLCIWCTA